MPDNRRFWTIGFIALFAFYCALRFWRMSDSCLWFDEIFSVHAAEHDWGSLLWFVAQDLIHPPLFYALLKLWIVVAGESVFWLRLLPVIFSCLALLPFYLLCRELKLENRVIAMAVFLLAVNGTFIKYAQLVRMYSLLMLLSLVSIWLFARYFNRGKNLTGLIIVNLLMIYTHYYGWMVIGCEIGAVLMFQRFKWRGMAAMTGILAGLFLPWIWLVWKASQTGSELSQNISWIARPGFAQLGTYMIDLTEPFYFQASSAEPASNYFISIPLLLVFVVASALFITRFRKAQSDERRSIYFLALFAFLPIIAVFIASWTLPHSIWGTRHMIIVGGPLMVLIALIFDRFAEGFARLAAIALMVLFVAFALAVQLRTATPVYVWCAWEGVADESGPSDGQRKVYTFEDLVAYHLWFGSRNSGKVEVFAIKGVEGMHEDESYFLPRGFDGVKRSSIDDIDESGGWLVFRTEKAGQENPLFDELQRRGFRVCPNTPRQFANQNVFVTQIVGPTKVCGT